LRLTPALQREILRGNGSPVRASLMLQAPVVDPDMRVAFLGFGEPQSRAAYPLVLPQPAASRVADRAVRDQ
jgi:hypothetical protein